MSEVMVPLRSPMPARLRGLGALACALAIMSVALGSTPGAQAAPGTSATKSPETITTPARASTAPPLASATPAHTSSTPTFPIPASAKIRPNQTPSAGAAGSGGTAGAPITTYVPSGTTATPLPGTVPAATAPSAGTPLNTPRRAPASARAQRKPSRTLSPAAIAIAAAAALLVLACSTWGLARRRAFEPHWALSLRHALAEAGMRSSLTWAEFVDWARIGR